MIGNFYRYAAECSNESALIRVRDEGLKAYLEADRLTQNLPGFNHKRLSLCLNFSIFYNEVMNDSHRACDLAEMALSRALETIPVEEVEERSFKNSMSIIDLIKDNLTIWRDTIENEEQAERQSRSNEKM